MANFSGKLVTLDLTIPLMESIRAVRVLVHLWEPRIRSSIIGVSLLGDNNEFVSNVPINLIYEDNPNCTRVITDISWSIYDHMIFDFNTF